jgi:hypothetical protein
MTRPETLRSIDGVVSVEVLRGSDAGEDDRPALLVEVPHGADRRAHYDALADRLQGQLPDDLHAFFHVNTDVGAWAYGRATASALLQARPALSALLVRSLIPRTLIDCNRPATGEGGDLAHGGVTAGIPPYVTDERDLKLLTTLHRQYIEVAEAAYAWVCGGGGLALNPHTYGPRSLGIARVDGEIVKNLRWACAPERHDTWPLRAEIDLLTRDQDGKLYAPEGIEEALSAAFTEAGFEPLANDTYCLHPATMGYVFSARHPGRVVCLEVRRDLLTDWDPLNEMIPDDGRVARVVTPLTKALAGFWG